MQMEIERDDARRDRDEWKASAAQYNDANEWLDAERTKFIAALRAIDPKHALLPENAPAHRPARTEKD